MASRTQLRLAQITGSYGANANAGEGRIIDALSPIGSSAAITTLTERSGSLVDNLSHLASAVKRLHGFTSFAGNETGNFNTALSVTGSFLAFDNAATLRTDTQELTISGSAGINISAPKSGDIAFQAEGGNALTLTVTDDADQTLALNVQDKDLIFQVNEGGSATEVMRLDGDVSALLVASGKEVRFGGAGTHIDGNGTTLSVAGNTNFANDVTITGDLTVSGDTVTLDVTNKSIEDQLIILNSGSAAVGNKQDVGIIFALPDISRVLFIDDSDANKFVFATTYTSGTATGTDAVVKKANADVVMGGLEAAASTISSLQVSDLTDNRVVIAGSSGELEDDGNLTFDGTELAVGVNQFSVTASNGRAQAKSFSLDGDNTIELNGGDLTINAQANMLLNFATAGKIAITEANTERGIFQSVDPGGAGEHFVLSSSAGIPLALASNDSEGKILIADDTADLGGNGFYLNVGTEDEFSIQTYDGNSKKLLGVRVSLDHYFSGSLAISGTHADPGSLKLLERSDNGENRFEINAPVSLSDNFAFTLPNSVGTQNQVLTLTNVAGNVMTLGYSSPITANVLSKRQIAIAAQLTSGSALDPNSATVSNAGPYTRSALDLSGIANSNLANLIDVYVNGQLLISGSDANVGAGTADYLVSTHSATSQLKFGFDLEVDDTVIINKKGE